MCSWDTSSGWKPFSRFSQANIRKIQWHTHRRTTLVALSVSNLPRLYSVCARISQTKRLFLLLKFSQRITLFELSLWPTQYVKLLQQFRLLRWMTTQATVNSHVCQSNLLKKTCTKQHNGRLCRWTVNTVNTPPHPQSGQHKKLRGPKIEQQKQSF